MSSPRTVYDELLVGAVDLHCHVDLEFSTTPVPQGAPRVGVAAARRGRRAPRRRPEVAPVALGVALPVSSPRSTRAGRCRTSITLNPSVGGVDPWAVEAAAAMGAKAVFMPTWGSRNDRERGGFHRRLAAGFEHFDPERLCTLSITDESGALTGGAQEVLRLALEKDLMLSTGHVSWAESLELAREAHRIGFDRLLFGHPMSGSVGAPAEAVKEAAGLGAYSRSAGRRSLPDGTTPPRSCGSSTTSAPPASSSPVTSSAAAIRRRRTCCGCSSGCSTTPGSPPRRSAWPRPSIRPRSSASPDPAFGGSNRPCGAPPSPCAPSHKGLMVLPMVLGGLPGPLCRAGKAGPLTGIGSDTISEQDGGGFATAVGGSLPRDADRR